MSENQDPAQGEEALIRTSDRSGLKSAEEPAKAPDVTETVRRCAQVYLRATEVNWPDGERKAIVDAVRDLADALAAFWGLSNGTVAPAAFPGVKAGPDALAQAFRLTIEQAAERADALVRALPACGTDS